MKFIHQHKSIFSIILVLSLIGSLIPPGSPALASGSVQLAPAINENSDVGQGQPTYTIFFDQTVAVDYAGGPVCLSSQPGQCSAPATDDAVKIFVNGTEVYSHVSYTQDYGPVDFSSYLQQGQNSVRVQLIDLMGPTRGGSALYLAFAGMSDISVVITPGGEFYSPDGKGGSRSIEGQEMASVPFSVQALKDGSPLAGAELWLTQPFSAYMGITNSEGRLDLPPGLAIPRPPQTGAYSIAIEARYGGETASSGPVTLYDVTLESSIERTITADEARTWGMDLFSKFFMDDQLSPGLPTPEIPRFRGSDTLIDILLALVKTVAFGARYQPRAGDQLFIQVYPYSGSGYPTAYLYYEKLVRDGQVVTDLEHYYWTHDVNKVLPQDGPNRLALAFRLASPATLFVTNPSGLSSGIDPTTSGRLFGYPMVLSSVGDEPFWATIPGPETGRYIVQVNGTGYGPYTFTTETLDKNGLSNALVSVSGLTAPGYVTRFYVDYDPESMIPVHVAVVGTVDIKPETLNLASKSTQNAVTAFVELPLGFDAKKIDPASVSLEGAIPAQLLPTSIGDHDLDGIPDVMIKFDRSRLVQYLRSKPAVAGAVRLTVTGIYEGAVGFTCTDSIVVLVKYLEDITR